jgi:hypothetical protein
MKRRDFIKAGGGAIAGAGLVNAATLDSLVDDLLLDEIAAEVAAESGGTVQSAASLEAKGCWAWYAEIFGQSFVDACGPHHRQAIEWHWNARTSLIMRLVVQFLAYFSIWARGNLKTTVARRMIICDACLSTTAGTGGYALIVGGTKKKVRGSASSIETLLALPTIKRYYPTLSRVKRNERGASKGWTADYINTEANYVFHFIGLDEGVAGANVDDIRPTLIVPDDIDDREDSPVISEGRFQTFTRAVLPTRQSNTLVFFAQNLISRFSCMYRIWKQHARVLTNRLLTNPIPAVNNLVTETRTVGGIVKDVVVSGECTWHMWDLQRVQEEIDTYGLKAFLRECQHEVEQGEEGLVVKNYNDSVHVISRSEFASIFGTRDLPRKWNKDVGNDWSRTKTKHHANVAGILTVSAQNSPLPGHLFFFHPMSFKAATEPEEVAKRILSAISPTVVTAERVFTWDELMDSTLRKTDLEHLISNQTELIKARRSVLASVIPELVTPILKAQNYNLFRGSHEQSKTGALAVYRKVFGLPFVGVNPGGDGGIDTLNMLTKVDYSQPHAFRPSQMGYTMLHIVVEDDRSNGPLFITEDGVEVYPPVPYNDALTPDDLHDGDLIRHQFKNCRYRDPYLTVLGEQEGDILKMDDDFINLFMMLLHDRVPVPTPLTHGELVEEVIPQQYRLVELQKQSPYENGLTPEAELTYIINRQFAERQVIPERRSFDEWGMPSD